MAYEIVAVGCSWGGLDALGALLESLEPDFCAPVVVAQHRPADPRSHMAHTIGRRSRLPVRDAEDKEPLRSGTVYLAPSDYHFIVERGTVALSTEGAVQFARPSIDVLFESVAHSYGASAIGVILTGANDDGAKGLAQVAAAGGLTVVQDPATSVRPEMPRAALAVVKPDAVLTLAEIGPFLIRACARQDSKLGGSSGR